MGVRLAPQAAQRLNVAKRGRRPRLVTASRIARYVELLEALGLTKWSEPLRVALSTAEQISADGDAARARIEAKRHELVGSVAEGDQSVEAAAVALEDAKRAEATAPVANEVARSAKARILRQAVRVLFDAEAELLTDLDAAVREAAAKVAKAAVAAKGIVTDADAVRAPAKARDAWASMIQQRGQIETGWRIAEMLRFDGLAHELPAPNPPAEEWRFGDAETYRRTRSPDATWRLALAIEGGAEPRVMTAQQLGERFRAMNAPAAAKQEAITW